MQYESFNFNADYPTFMFSEDYFAADVCTGKEPEFRINKRKNNAVSVLVYRLTDRLISVPEFGAQLLIFRKDEFFITNRVFSALANRLF